MKDKKFALAVIWLKSKNIDDSMAIFIEAITNDLPCHASMQILQPFSQSSSETGLMIGMKASVTTV